MSRKVVYGHNIKVSFNGECNGRCKYSDLLVRVIKRIRELGIGPKAISDMLDIPRRSVQDMIYVRKPTELVLQAKSK